MRVVFPPYEEHGGTTASSQTTQTAEYRLQHRPAAVPRADVLYSEPATQERQGLTSDGEHVP